MSLADKFLRGIAVSLLETLATMRCGGISAASYRLIKSGRFSGIFYRSTIASPLMDPSGAKNDGRSRFVATSQSVFKDDTICSI
jgi:hypothetical protein